ncbi:acyltransferase [Stieleria sp. TO1_6]|nr:acyltransferase [Stieleria tagensis]
MLFFHGGIGFPGGFTGVDVFFVISGFLIGGNIDRSLRAGNFSLFEFWFRRIRRILPSSLAVGAVTLAAGYALLLPQDLADLANSMFAQLCMVSNFYFAEAGDYFGTQSETWPLLHTWSLSVEEQFYIVFPLLLWKFTGVWRRRLLLTGFVASFALAVIAVHQFPQQTFYLLPTRAWQLLAGALAYEWFHSKPLSSGKARLASQFGVVAVVLPMLLLSDEIPFPGWAAVPSTLGAACLLVGLREHRGWIYRLLSSRWPVKCGQVSYSLYLWHWPPLAFANYFYPSGPPLSVRFLALTVGVVLTLIAYAAVEKPLRLKGPIHQVRPTLVATFVVIFALLSWSWLTSVSKGFPNRFADLSLLQNESEELSGQFQTRHAEDLTAERLPQIGSAIAEPSFLLWGDSHTYSLAAVFDEFARRSGVSGLVCARNATAPVVDTWRPHYQGNSLEAITWNDSVRNLVSQQGIKRVYLICRWDVAVFGRPSGKMDTLIAPAGKFGTGVESSMQTLRSGLQKMVADLSADGVSVILIAQPLTLQCHPNRTAALFSHFDRQSMLENSVATVNRTQRERIAEMLRSLRSNSVAIIEPDDGDLTSNGLMAVSFVAGQSQYMDTNHLTPAGAKRLYGGAIEREMVLLGSESTIGSNGPPETR